MNDRHRHAGHHAMQFEPRFVAFGRIEEWLLDEENRMLLGKATEELLGPLPDEAPAQVAEDDDAMLDLGRLLIARQRRSDGGRLGGQAGGRISEGTFRGIRCGAKGKTAIGRAGIEQRRELIVLRAGRLGEIGKLAHPIISNRGIIAELVDQRSFHAAQRAIGKADQLVKADLMELADAVRHRRVPVQVIDERPPDHTIERDTARPQFSGVVEKLVEPDFAIDRPAFDAGLGDDHRQAIAVEVRLRHALETRRHIGAALAQLAVVPIKLPVTVRVVIKAEHVGRLRVIAQPLKIKLAESVAGEPLKQRMMVIDAAGDQVHHDEPAKIAHRHFVAQFLVPRLIHLGGVAEDNAGLGRGIADGANRPAGRLRQTRQHWHVPAPLPTVRRPESEVAGEERTHQWLIDRGPRLHLSSISLGHSA